jgi:hypothetical protein
MGVWRGALGFLFVAACAYSKSTGDAGSSDAGGDAIAPKDGSASDVVTNNDASGGCTKTCATGCCSGDSCLAGTDDTACGFAAVACEDCTQSGEVCNGQVCSQPVCDKNSCPKGCCKQGQCLAGQSDQACGTNGVTCIDCSAQSLICLNGYCTQ